VTAFKTEVAKAARRPSLVLKLYPAVFAETWDDRPREPVDVGIRTIGEREFSDARRSAARQAWAEYPDDNEEPLRDAAFNDHLHANCAARAACAPHDITIPFFGDMAEDQIGLALTEEGIRTISAALDRATVGESPIYPEAADADFARLAEAAPAALAAMSGGRARRLRRLAHFLLTELTTPSG
jgi:hypothetical protein